MSLLDSIGMPSVVALMGTKLTTDHIAILKKLNVEIRLCLDGDAAGQKGMMSIMPMLDANNIPYRIVSVPKEVRDPDEILKQDGPEALRKFVSTLVDPFTFALNYYENTSPLGSREDSEKVIRHFIPMLTSTKNKLVYDDYMIKLSKVTGFEVRAIQEFVRANKKYKEEQNDSYDAIYFEDFPEQAVQKLQTRKNLRRLQLAERAIMLQMINSKQAVEYYERHINNFIDEVYHQLALYILDYYETHGDIDVTSIMDAIALNNDENRVKLVSTLSNLIMEKNVPVYDVKAMDEYAKTISLEKDQISNEQELQNQIVGKNESEKLAKMKEFLDKRKSDIETSKNMTNKPRR